MIRVLCVPFFMYYLRRIVIDSGSSGGLGMISDLLELFRLKSIIPSYYLLKFRLNHIRPHIALFYFLHKANLRKSCPKLYISVNA